MFSALHEITALVYQSSATQFEQLQRLVGLNLGLKLIAGQSAVIRMALYCEISLVVAQTHPYGSVCTIHVALSYPAA